MKKNILIFVLILVNRILADYSLSGEVKVPSGVSPDMVNIYIESLDGTYQDSKLITSLLARDFSYVFEGVPAGEYLLYASLVFVTTAQSLDIYYPDRISGNCAGSFSDTIEVQSNLSNTDLELTNYGALEVELIKENSDYEFAAILFKNNASENCFIWNLRKDYLIEEQQIWKNNFIEAGEYQLIYQSSALGQDTTVYYDEIITIAQGQSVSITWNLQKEISFLESPDTTKVTRNEITLEWKTSEACICSLFYSDNYAAFVSEEFEDELIAFEGNTSQLKTQYQCQLTSLIPGKGYYFRIDIWKNKTEKISESPFYYFQTESPVIYIFDQPYVSHVSNSEATINWETNQECVCSLFYKTYLSMDDGSLIEQEWQAFPELITSEDTKFSVTLRDLPDNKMYFYKVRLYSDSSLEYETFGLNYFITLFKYEQKPFVLAKPPTVPIKTSEITFIEYETDEPVKGFCRLLKDGQEIDFKFDIAIEYGIMENFMNHHFFIFEGLTPATTYTYQIGTFDENNQPVTYYQDYYFTTLSGNDFFSPVLVSGPYIAISADKASITFETDEPVNGAINLIQNLEVVQTITLEDFQSKHQVYLRKLLPQTEYFFTFDLKDFAGNILNYQGGKSLLSKIGLENPQTNFSSNSFTTNATADITPPRFLTMPAVIDISDSSAMIGLRSNEQVKYKIIIKTGLNQTVFWKENDEYEQNHTIFISRLEPGTQYSAEIVINDIERNSDSLKTPLVFTTKTQVPEYQANSVESATIYNIDNVAVISWKTDFAFYPQTQLSISSDLSAPYFYSDDQYSSNHVIVCNQLENNQDYFYQLSGQNLTYQNIFTANTDNFSQSPGNLGNLAFTEQPAAVYKTDSLIKINWKTNQIAGSVCEYYAVSEPSVRYSVSGEQVSKEHSLLIAPLEPNTQYSFTIYSRSLEEQLINTTLTAATESESFQDNTPPESPSSLQLKRTSNGDYLTWPGSGSVDLSGYVVYQKKNILLETLASNFTSTKFLIADETSYTYAVAAIDYAGNISDTIFSREVSIEENGLPAHQLSVKVYPNPCSKFLNLYVKSPVAQEITLIFYDILGKKIYSAKKNVESGVKILYINTMDWKNGIYFCRLVAESEETITKKIILLK